MSLCALMLFLPPSRESFGVGASWQKISFGKKGAKRKNFIVSEHFLGHHFGLFHKMWVYLFWDWQISSWGTGGSIDSFRFFFAMLPMKSSLHWINALFASYMMVSFAREEVFASLQYFKHAKSHSNQHSHDILWVFSSLMDWQKGLSLYSCFSIVPFIELSFIAIKTWILYWYFHLGSIIASATQWEGEE